MTFHLYRIDEIFSNADGTVQFVELTTESNFEEQWGGQTLAVTNGQTHTFTFPENLPSFQTGGTHVLVATQGFANLNIVTPDYIIPNGFLFTAGGHLVFGGFASTVDYGALPIDGTHSVDAAGNVALASPTNFAGATGVLQAPVNVATGNALANLMTGTAGDDELHGLGGNDTLDGGSGGHDTLDGGTGVDTAIVRVATGGVQSISLDNGHLHIATSIGETTFIDVERIRFNDALVALDTQANSPLWQADALLWAALGSAPPTPLLSQWTHAADVAPSMASLAQQLLDFYVPAVPTASLVTYLFNTVLHAVPASGQAEQIAGLVGHGQMFETNGALLAYVASQAVNTDRMVGFTGSSYQLLDPSYF